VIHSHRVPVIPAFGRTDNTHGTVVAARDQSVKAGMAMLEQGGNAIDAAVAAALVAGVIEPTETTLAGSGFLLYSDGESGPWSVDFGPRAPLTASSAMFDIDFDSESSNVLGLAPVVGAGNVNGPTAFGVPRTLLGLLTAHERWGSLDRRVVCEPAIRLATDGFPADTWFLMNALNDLDRLRRDPQAAATFLDSDGLPLGRRSSAHYGASVDKHGMVRQPLLASTLEEAAAGSLDDLRDGPIARRLIETANEIGSLLTLADLKGSAPTIERPLSIRFRDVDVWVPTSPGGGITELQILSTWQALFPSGSPRDDSSDRTRMLALAIRHAFADRYHWLGDPEFVSVPIEGLLSAEYAAVLADLCGSADPDLLISDGEPPWIKFASEPIHNPWEHSSNCEGEIPVWTPRSASTPTSGTTHISVADSQGRIVSITHTAANHFGSGIICPRTGLLFDSSMAWFNALPGAANSIRGGARPVANMGPVLLTRDGVSVAALGASGGRRIISAVAQVVINLVDREMSPLEALQAPRIDGSGGELLIHENLADVASGLDGLNPVMVPEGIEAYAIDFARSNIAAYHGENRTESAIDGKSFTN
jgi:gamma-glutamyltranspeptidase/glutathione hydrolase